jgi:RNA polymerase sigma factor (sigma-70 family)
MQTRTPLKVAALLVAGALPGWRAASVRLVTSVQSEDKPAASAELDRTVRPVFVLANQRRRWELDDLARRLDEQQAAVELSEGLVPAPASSASGLTPDGHRMLPAIDELLKDEREVFDLVWIDGISQAEAAQMLGVSAVMVKRRLSRGLRLLTEQLADLRPTRSRRTRSRWRPGGSGFPGCRSPGTQPPRGAQSWLSIRG